MSLGHVDIALVEIDRSDEHLARFAADPTGFLDGFDLDLTVSERSALETWDCGELYGMGAHPFLLFQAARSLAVAAGTPVPEFVAAYLEAVEGLGTPDFIT